MGGLLRIWSANVLSSLIDNSFVLRLFEKQKYIYVKDKSISTPPIHSYPCMYLTG